MNSQSGDILKERHKKFEAIKALGVYPFGARFAKNDPVASALDGFKEKKRVRSAGRLSAMRLMGKTVFCDLKDESGKIQLYVKREEMPEKDYRLFECLDIGDIIGVEGELFKTRMGEITIRVESLKLLAKSLRPMPEKWHGLKDVEIRYRQRYLDLIANDQARDIFKKRSLVIRSIRRLLDDKGYLEVETPMMHPIPGGAAGKPFKTHHEALDLDLYLRVAPELYLKRLLVGGFEKVYEINKSFRNEGISTRHNPEFTMLEVYTAYHDVEDVMNLTEELIKKTAQDVFGSLVIQSGDQVLDLSRWERVSFKDIMKKHFGIAPEDSTETWIKKFNERGHKFKGDFSRTQLINIVSDLVTPKSSSSGKECPVFVTDYFAELSPLAKKNQENPSLSERFELYIGGMEVANGYSEQNNPIEQRQRFLSELNEKEKLSDRIDEDFLLALEYGMPPAGGLGIGIDRLVMLLTHQPTIREVILFPQMKAEQK